MNREGEGGGGVNFVLHLLPPSQYVVCACPTLCCVYIHPRCLLITWDTSFFSSNFALISEGEREREDVFYDHMICVHQTSHAECSIIAGSCFKATARYIGTINMMGGGGGRLGKGAIS